MYEERWFDTGDVRLHYVEGPKTGPPIILLHGATEMWQEWLPALPFLTQRWHCHAFDLRGHGQSGHASSYLFSDFADDICRFLQEMVQESPVILGHSLGGIVGIHIAARISLRGLIVGDSPLCPETIQAVFGPPADEYPDLTDAIGADYTAEEIYEKLVETSVDLHPVWLRYWARARTSADANLPEFIMRELHQSDTSTFFPQIACPVLLLRSAVMSEGDVVRARSDIENVTVAEFEDDFFQYRVPAKIP